MCIIPNARVCRAGSDSEKEADVAEHRKLFNHVGLLVNEPPVPAELPFTLSSDEPD
jgi:hypothetical protein